jgi:hypothetical protein
MLYRVWDRLRALCTFGQAGSRAALSCLVLRLGSRSEREWETWTTDIARQGVDESVPRFVQEFLTSRGIPAQKIASIDRLQADLMLNNVLWRDWEWDFDEEFKRQFGVSPIRAGLLNSDPTMAEFLRSLADVIGRSSRQTL